jgi:hypothetical protein
LYAVSSSARSFVEKYSLAELYRFFGSGDKSLLLEKSNKDGLGMALSLNQKLHVVH